jgi:hypothetical protein
VIDVLEPGFEDPGIRDLVSSLSANGPIDRDDMIKILQFAASEYSSVDQSELDDLNLILAHPTLYRIPDSVEILASDVVDGNRANANFQGQPLGNLVAGSTTVQMNDLIDKWFLGADHPVADGTYVLFAGSLFDGSPSYLDMQQGSVGDCYLIAALGALAHADPSAIQNMFQDNGDGTWTVRFYNQGVADYVTVDRYLPAGCAGVGGNSTSSANVLWVALAEKAYAEWNETGNEAALNIPGDNYMRDGTNSYAGLDGGLSNAVFQQVIGNDSRVQCDVTDLTEQQLIDALAANDAVVANTCTAAAAAGLVTGHAYAVLSYDPASDLFLLGNPWGVDSFPTPPISFAQLQTYAGVFDIADASGTVPFDSGLSPLAVSGTSSAGFAVASAHDPTFAAPIVRVSLPLDSGQSPLAAPGARSAGADRAPGHGFASAAPVVPVAYWEPVSDAPSDWWRDALTARLRRRRAAITTATPRLWQPVEPATIDALFT